MIHKKIFQCPHCNGKGELYTASDKALLFFTFGMAFMLGKSKCNHCKGAGFIVMGFKDDE